MRNYAVIQAVMMVKGVYDGEIDGLWGPLSQDAIRVWATDTSFDPALPTRGQPFTIGQKLPKGLSWRMKDGEQQIVWDGMPKGEAAKVDELMSKYQPLTMEQVEIHIGLRQPQTKPVPAAQAKPLPLPTKVKVESAPDEAATENNVA